MTTMTNPSHPSTSRTSRAAEPAEAGPLHLQSAAFLREVRWQWAVTTSWYDDAAARGDDTDQQDALDRFQELRELLWHHDLSLEVLRLGAPS